MGFNAPLSVTEEWSAAPDFLKIISDYCLEYKPLNIVECSSGVSSVILSKCCEINKVGHVYSLENGEEFAEQTQAQAELEDEIMRFAEENALTDPENLSIILTLLGMSFSSSQSRATSTGIGWGSQAPGLAYSWLSPAAWGSGSGG